MDRVEGRFNIIAFIMTCMRNYYVFVGFGVVFAALALWQSATTAPVYIASAVIAPPTGNGMSASGSGALSALGITRQLAGSNNSDEVFTQYLQLLQSYKLADSLAKHSDLLQVVFASRWDTATNSWKPQSSFRVAAKQVASVFTHRPLRDHPTADDLQGFIASKVGTTKLLSATAASLIRTNSLIMVSVTYKDPQKAQHILATVLDEADKIMRQSRLSDVQRRIAYLDSILPTINATEERTALIMALSSQRELLATLNADERYASTLIDPPYASQLPIAPNPYKSLTYAIFMAFLAGAAAVYFFGERIEDLRMFLSEKNRLFRFILDRQMTFAAKDSYLGIMGS